MQVQDINIGSHVADYGLSQFCAPEAEPVPGRGASVCRPYGLTPTSLAKTVAESRAVRAFKCPSSVGAAHSRSCASGNTLAPAGITHGLYFQGCAYTEWLPPIKIGNVNSSQRASAECKLAPLDNYPPRKHSAMTFLSGFIEPSSIGMFFAAGGVASIFSTLRSWLGGAVRCR